MDAGPDKSGFIHPASTNPILFRNAYEWAKSHQPLMHNHLGVVPIPLPDLFIFLFLLLKTT